jgi:hypothetical protein
MPAAACSTVSSTRWPGCGAARAGSARRRPAGYSLGDRAEEVARANLSHYYAFAGEYASAIADAAAKSPEAVRAEIAAYEQAGCDEVICFPASADPAQVDLLAEAVGL